MTRFLTLFIWILASTLCFAQEGFNFEGNHFVASYYNCDERAISNAESLEQAIAEAIEASGATILGSASHHFIPEGLTFVFLLSESHASIHTYPEYRCCFVDLFTCGNTCCSKAFDAHLREYLKPADVQSQVLIRN